MKCSDDIQKREKLENITQQFWILDDENISKLIELFTATFDRRSTNGITC